MGSIPWTESNSKQHCLISDWMSRRADQLYSCWQDIFCVSESWPLDGKWMEVFLELWPPNKLGQDMLQHPKMMAIGPYYFQNKYKIVCFNESCWCTKEVLGVHWGNIWAIIGACIMGAHIGQTGSFILVLVMSSGSGPTPNPLTALWASTHEPFLSFRL